MLTARENRNEDEEKARAKGRSFEIKERLVAIAARGLNEKEKGKGRRNFVAEFAIRKRNGEGPYTRVHARGSTRIRAQVAGHRARRNLAPHVSSVVLLLRRRCESVYLSVSSLTVLGGATLTSRARPAEVSQNPPPPPPPRPPSLSARRRSASLLSISLRCASLLRSQR